MNQHKQIVASAGFDGGILQGKGKGISRKKTYLTAKEATAWLDIKRETLYAYVSRGLVRTTVDAHDAHARLYLRDDLEALKTRSAARRGHAPVAAGALRWGEPVLETAVSSVENGRLGYRGLDVEDLVARGIPFENVAELLWSGVLPTAAVIWDDAPRARLKAALDVEMRAASEQATAATWFRRVNLRLALAAQADDGQDETSFTATGRARAVIRLVARRDAAASRDPVAALVVARFIPRIGAGHLAAAVRVVDQALVLSADHELNSSTFAARIAASTGADLYAAFGAGLGAMSGPLHGGAFAPIEDLLDQIRTPKEARQAITAARAQRRSVPGFGHPLYPLGDPRAKALFAAIGRHPSPSKKAAARRDIIEALVKAAYDEDLPPPSVDLALVAVTTVLGMPRGTANALFTIGRLAGWTAHILEQRMMDFQLRPRAKYVGRPIGGAALDEKSF